MTTKAKYVKDRKMDLIFVITILVALSGWGKVLYDHLNTIPDIRGRVFNVMVGNMKNPLIPEQQLTSFVAYAYLINSKPNTIHVLDYEMEIRIDDKWIRLSRVYGVHQVENLDFLAPDGQKIVISNFATNLINRKNLPVEYGKPLHGWLVFAGDASLYGKTIAEYKLVCIDAHDKRHEIITNPQTFTNLAALQDIAEIRFIPKSAMGKQ